MQSKLDAEQTVAKPNVLNFSERLAEWATQSDLGVDAEVREQARFTLIDTLSCMVLGATERQATAASDAMLFGLRQGSVPPVGGGEMLSITGAALANGARAAALDFDDYELSGSSHASAPVLSALLSLAHKVPMTIDEMNDAWIVGYETIIWMGKALGYGHYDIGWHSTSTLGPIGTAAAVSKALGLSARQMFNAMALAVSSSSGLLTQIGYDAKALHTGLAAEAGLRAALLGRADATGNCNLWDSEFGFTKVYGTPESIGFREMMKTMELGQAVQQYPVIRKLWPSCAYTQRPIYGAIELSQQIKHPSDIASVKIRMPAPFHRVAGFGVPDNDAEARFSVRYCIAVGLLEGRVVPGDFEPDGFNDPQRRELTASIELDLYDLPKGDTGDIGPTTPETITVELKDGQVISHEMTFVPGGASMPMTKADLMQKVRACGCSVELAQAYLAAHGDTPLLDTGLLGQVSPPMMARAG
ncbi:MmgE/PrpD family protein [Ruegeria sp. HKCCD4332]|uniref:MmgE/PrpD family protein n=1 Tax=Ruegeria sp. HKCCD4332 TaxID=2683021 RepID=UPI001491F709|nr:MmgE/PrpD family protein [Ruegeria sp. HKCCD4332]NOD77762.1 MmgE/PrpD family protein [Ruegeria sp. HKCCD4332]